MFRIRLATGEESDYHSVPELAQGIRSGRIPGNAEIYHRTSRRWLPISAHPAWDEAAPQPLEATGLSEGMAQPRPGEPVWGKTVRIYQMYSQSGREIEERRRPTWVPPLASLGAAGVLAAALALALAPGFRVPDGTVRPALTLSRVPGRAPTPAFSSTAARAWPDAPYNLAERMRHAVDSGGRVLAEVHRQLGLRNPLAPGRLRSPDSLQAGRRALHTFRLALARYRDLREDVAVAYDDTATALVKLGAWTAADRQEWDVRAIPPEPPSERTRADSALVLYDRLFFLLVDQVGEYGWDVGVIRFRTPEGVQNYQQLRSGLRGLVTVPDPYAQRVSPALALVLPGPADTIPPALLAGLP